VVDLDSSNPLPSPPCTVQIHVGLDPLDIQSIQRDLIDRDCGAQSIFVGTTRETTDGRVTKHLSYEAYQPMAESQLHQLAVDAAERWPLRRVIIHHRLGTVEVGQASVIVGVASPHRRAAIEAIPWMMDRLKQDVPIWKRETFGDGASQWIHPAPEAPRNRNT
jgi:molybdopterin synthase catalytic subunit